MSTESDAKRFARAAETHFNADFGDPICNKKEKIMLELCKKYFMTDEEDAFYDLLLTGESKIARVEAASHAERLRYDLKNVLSLVEHSKSERWIFSDDPKKQNEALNGINNTIRFTKESIIDQQKFNDDRLFRQIAMYLFLLVDYNDAWSGFKPEKAAERWHELLRYVEEQIVKEGKQKKFFDEMLTKTQRGQRLVTAMVCAAIKYDIQRSVEVLETLLASDVLNSRLTARAENQLKKIRNNEMIDGL